MQSRVLSLSVDRLLSIERSHSLAEVTEPRASPDGVDPEAYGRINGQDTASRYIDHALCNEILEAARNNAQYELGNKESALDKFEVPTIKNALLMWFLYFNWQNTNFLSWV